MRAHEWWLCLLCVCVECSVVWRSGCAVGVSGWGEVDAR